jgi:hypothetical protein
MTNKKGFKPVSEKERAIARAIEHFRAGWLARGDMQEKDYPKALKAFCRLVRKGEV